MGKIRSITVALRNNSWVIDYYDNEKKRRRESFESRRDAENRKRDLQAEFAGFIRPEPVVERSIDQGSEVDKTIKQALIEYDETVGAKKNPVTRRNESYYFDELYLFLNNVRKRIYICEVTVQDMAAFQTLLFSNDLMGSTINRKFHAYDSFFANMVDWGLIAKSPSHPIKNLPEDDTARQVWTDDQIKLYYDTLPRWAKDVTYFLASTGFRPGQASKLVWLAVDLERHLIKTRVEKGGKIRELLLPITQEMVFFLSEKKKTLRREFLAKPTDPVFLNSKGKKMTPQNYCRAVKVVTRKLVKKDLVPDGLVPYGLRHTFLTNLVELGVQARKIQLLAGHQKFSTTTRYTGMVKTESLREAIVEAEASRRFSK